MAVDGAQGSSIPKRAEAYVWIGGPDALRNAEFNMVKPTAEESKDQDIADRVALSRGEHCTISTANYPARGQSQHATSQIAGGQGAGPAQGTRRREIDSNRTK